MLNEVAQAQRSNNETFPPLVWSNVSTSSLAQHTWSENELAFHVSHIKHYGMTMSLLQYLIRFLLQLQNRPDVIIVQRVYKQYDTLVSS
jgi:hypothetical protein